jgi:uncharacterized protein
MIPRRVTSEVAWRLENTPAVALVGPRQVGKTTLALQVATEHSAVYLDLEDAGDRGRMGSARHYFDDHSDQLVILDEIHRTPGLFETLRGAIDAGRREGKGTARFLLLGSAALELLAQSGETLAGRIGFVELTPFDVTEVGAERLDELWVRGGFPSSFLAPDDRASAVWRQDFIRTYLERDIPELGPRIPAETLRRLWTMLAHLQGGLLNAAQLARNLEVTGATIGRYIDLLVDLLLVRRLSPRMANVGKRLVRAPKVYVRDSGLVHALLGVADKEGLLGHPVVGASWEGMAIENLLSILGNRALPSFYRTHKGAEIDLILDWPNGSTWAIEIKRTAAPKLERGTRSALEDLRPERSFVVYAGSERFRLAETVEAIGLADLCAELSAAP